MSVDTNLNSSNRIRLTGFNWFSHYAFVLLLLVPIAVSIYDEIVDPGRLINPREIGLVAVSLITFPLAFRVRARGLLYKVVLVTDAPGGFYNTVMEGVVELGWNIEQSEINKSIVAHVPASGFSWGELVVVHFCDDRILANSIQFPVQEAMAPWRNRANIRTIEAMLGSS